jgi:hypothetical protein
MGYYPPRIQSHFQALSKKISKRYWKYQKSKHPDSKEIKRTLEKALEEEPPPSLQSVLRRLGCVNTGYYYSNYPDQCFAITGRYKEWRNNPFHEGKDQKRLEAALKENPPPSFSEIARRFRHNREFIRLKFPELSEKLTSRYKNYQETLRKEKAAKLRYAIRDAIRQLRASGLNVSEARVKELVKQQIPTLGRDCLFKQALREMKIEAGIG